MEADPSLAILSEVETFLRSSGMSHSTFGRKTVNDPKFVNQLREGRDLRRTTRAKIRAFIEGAKKTVEA